MKLPQNTQICARRLVVVVCRQVLALVLLSRYWATASYIRQHVTRNNPEGKGKSLKLYPSQLNALLLGLGPCFQSVSSAAQWSSFNGCQSVSFLSRAANYPRPAELYSYLVTKERERLLLLSLPGIFSKKQYCLLVF